MMESVGIISKLIDSEVGKLGDPKKVWVGGFSQGCALSLATMIYYPKALGGVIGLSGMNATQIDWVQVPEIEDKRKIPIFLYHGESDGVISQKIAKLTYDDLIK
jgi:phospholipase/carboxylesterase